jgi:hypothetical protein
MSSIDDAALMGQGMNETPRTDKALHEVYAGGSRYSFPEQARQIERELNQAIKERDQARLSLRTLISLHEREIETGEPITGEDWEIAGYALGDKQEPRSRICKPGEAQWGFDSGEMIGQITNDDSLDKTIDGGDSFITN